MIGWLMKGFEVDPLGTCIFLGAVLLGSVMFLCMIPLFLHPDS